MANHTGKGIPDRTLAITPPILPDEVPVTQTVNAMGTWYEAGAGVCGPGPGLVNRPRVLGSARALRRDPHEHRVRVGVEAQEGAQASAPRIRVCGGCDEQVVVERYRVVQANVFQRGQLDPRGGGIQVHRRVLVRRVLVEYEFSFGSELL